MDQNAADRNDPTATTVGDDDAAVGATPLAPTEHDPEASHGSATTMAFDRLTLPEPPGAKPPTVGNGAATTAGAMPVVPGYEIKTVLGRGGMGVVYLAREVRLNRLCALKMILAGSHAGPQSVSRFLREAMTVARLHHPQIVQIHGLGDCEGRPYLELEYVEGGDLQEHVRGRTLNARDGARLAEQLTHPVHEAHRLGIVHRDLKPGNILLTTDGVPKVSDFGLAKMLDDQSGLTGAETTLGTPSYMAPEQASGRLALVGPAADVYALGAILYELITGRPPFQAATALETLHLVKTTDAVPPRRLQPALPRDLETICLTCLRKEPGARYASAEALGDDLRRFLAGEPIRARAVPAWERVGKWVRRRPLPAALAAGLVAAVAGLLVLGAWSYLEIRNALGVARVARRGADTARADAERSRNEAIAARNVAVAEAYRALLSETRTLRAAHPPGWRRRALEDIGRLATMDTPGRDLTALRGEAVAVLGGLDAYEVARLGGLKGVWSLDFSPDGALLAMADMGGRVHLFDPARGRDVRVLADPEADPRKLYTKRAPMPAVRFKPDGGGIAYATWGRGVALMSPSDATPAKTLIGPKGLPRSVAFDRRGARVAVAWSDGRAGVYDAATGAEIRIVAGPDFSNQIPVAISPEGDRFATTGADHSVRVWAVEGGEPVNLGRHVEYIRALTFSPDGSRIAAASSDGAVNVWDANRPEVRMALGGHSSAANGVAFSPDGDLLASVGDDQTLRIWDVYRGRALLSVRPGVGPLTAVAFSTDGDRVAVGSDTAVVFELSGRRERRALAGHAYEISDLAHHPTRPLLASASGDQHIIVWDTRTGAPQRRWKADDTRSIRALAASPAGRWLAIGTGAFENRHYWDFPVLLRGFETDELSRSFVGHEAEVNALAFDPSGRRLASADQAGTVITWDVATGLLLRRERHGGEPVAALVFAGSALIVGQGDRLIVRDRGGGVPPSEVVVKGEVRSLAIAPDGSRLFVGTGTGAVRTFGLPGVEPSRSLEGAHRRPVDTLALGGGGTLLATAGDDGRIVLRDARTLDALLVLPDHEGPVHRLSFDPSGTRLAVGGVEVDVTIWDLARVLPALDGIGLGVGPSAAAHQDHPAPAVAERAGFQPVERAWAQMSVGEILRWKGKPGEALTAYEASATLWETTLRTEPVNAFYRSELTVCRASVAFLNDQLGRHDLAARRMSEAVDRAGSNHDLDPRVAFNRARVLALASALETREPARQRTLADRAIGSLRAAVAAGYHDSRQLKDNPDLASLRDRADFKRLIETREFDPGWPALIREGRDAAARDRFDVAIGHLARAREILRGLIAADPNDSWLRAQLAITSSLIGAAHAGADRLADATASARDAQETLDATPSAGPDAWYELARTLARLGPDQADAAVAALRRCVAGGFDDVGRLDTDAAFDAIRSRRDFRALVAEVILEDAFGDE